MATCSEAENPGDPFRVRRELDSREVDTLMTDAAAPAVPISSGVLLQLPLPADRSAATLNRVTSSKERQLRLRTLVDTYVDFVSRVLRNAGTPEADIDDDVQRTFIAVANRLDDIREGAEKTFLLQTALRVAAHARRTIARRREVQSELAPEMADPAATPEQAMDHRCARELLDVILGAMTSDLRTVFVLHEFEDMNMAEIAVTLGIPRGTVASRLRRARLDFQERVRAIEGISNAEAG